MSHISEFMEQVRRSPPPRRGNISSAWDCFTTASKTSKLYRSMGRSVNRRVSYAADLIASNEELEFPHTKSFIAGTIWSVYKVSPLWNLKYQERKKKFADDTDYNLEERERLLYDQKALKRYAAVIQGFITTDSSVSDVYKVDISALQGLRGSRNDKDALLIEVRVCWGDQDRIIFNGVLCGIETSELMIKSANATSLPVLLTSGNVDTVDRVLYGLSKCFDCVISPLIFSVYELKWAAGLWVGLEKEEDKENISVDCTIQQPSRTKKRKVVSSKENISPENQQETVAKTRKRKMAAALSSDVVFHYSIPQTMKTTKEKISTMKLTFDAAEVKSLWRCVHKDGENEITETEMLSFHSSLNMHIKESLELKVDRLDLEEVRLPFVSLSAGGKIRIQDETHVKLILRHLTVMCQGEMLTANPCLGDAEETME